MSENKGLYNKGMYSSAENYIVKRGDRSAPLLRQGMPRMSLQKKPRCLSLRHVNAFFLGSAVVFSFFLLECRLPGYAQSGFTYDSKGRRNPFIPLVTPEGKLVKLDSDEKETGGMVLEGLIYDKSGISYAILNGAVVKIGDMVNDSQVLKIEKNKVILIKDGEVSEVKLEGGEE